VLVVAGGMHATMSGGRFENNTARMGVAVLGGSRLTIRNTHFVDNRMCKGVLYGFPKSEMNVQGAVFEDNRAGDHGGAVYMDTCTAEFSSCDFTRNMAGEDGGAFHVKHSTLVVSGSTCSNNTAPTGGALAVYNSTVVINDTSVFKLNRACSVQSLAPGGGDNYYKLGVAGAIFSETSVVSISDTEFSENKAIMVGGEHYAVGNTPECCTGEHAVDVP
jgi:predicted outer membrane repeat protein